MKVLYIAWEAPYDKVCHAGGQTLNYYIKGLADSGAEVTMIAFCMEDEEDKLDTEEYGIKTYTIVKKYRDKYSLSNLQSINSKVNPYHKYCNLFSRKSAVAMLKKIDKVKESGYTPDVIVLEWTESLLLIEYIKKIYPDAKYVASEHDITFQRRMREAATRHSKLADIRADNMRERELETLRKCDKIVVHNDKDRKILTDNQIDNRKIHTIVPKYHQTERPYQRENNKILFFGDITKRENIEAVNWFKDKVMPLLGGTECSFDVLGKGARYVESIDDEFSEGMCFVCPLIHGAGIKVKNLEAMYAGIPVLTNEVGIEGIPATDGKDYLHCETPMEYAAGIKRIYSGDLNINGSQCIKDNFNQQESLERYISMMKDLANGDGI